jgi:hypothetical protein
MRHLPQCSYGHEISTIQKALLTFAAKLNFQIEENYIYIMSENHECSCDCIWFIGL